MSARPVVEGVVDGPGHRVPVCDVLLLRFEPSIPLAPPRLGQFLRCLLPPQELACAVDQLQKPIDVSDDKRTRKPELLSHRGITKALWGWPPQAWVGS